MDIEIARTALERTRLVTLPRHDLGPNEARLAIDRWALTANNITYGVFGDAMKYWDFFPAQPSDDADPTVWGRIPVWGFAEVVETRSADVSVGERVYGYLPMSTELVVTVGRANERSFTDVAPHRQPMAGAYNGYVRCASDPVHRADREAHQMVLYPLFFTSFVVDDFLGDHGDFGAEQVVISSMSSKTAIGVAFLARERGLRVVGLTSPGNVELVNELGVADEVLTYDRVADLPVAASAFVDVAGNRDVVRAIHTRLGAELGHSMIVGGTHWSHQADEVTAPLPGPRPEFLFAPGQISKRSKEWGRDVLDAKVADAWERYASWADTWVQFLDARGPDEVVAAYLRVLAGSADPRTGQVCSLSEVSP